MIRHAHRPVGEQKAGQADWLRSGECQVPDRARLRRPERHFFLAIDLERRQIFLELEDCVVRDRGTVETQRPELGKPLR